MLAIASASVLTLLLSGCQENLSNLAPSKVPERGFSSKSVDEGRFILHFLDKWQPCNSTSYLAPTVQTEIVENAGALFVLGDPVSEWGCGCDGHNLTFWADNSTQAVYVVEDPNDMCGTPGVRSDVTCAGFDTPLDKCLDGTSATEAAFGFLVNDVEEKDHGNLAVFQELVVPVVRAVLTATTATNLDMNFCLGHWTGSHIKEHSGLSDTSLSKDGCTAPPYVDANKYTIVSMMIPTMVLNTLGVCGDILPNSQFSFCVAFTVCDKQPTFALQLSSAALGCLFSNGGASVASGGLTAVIGNGVSGVLSSVGFGISPTGEFYKTFKSFDGSLVDAGLNGNVYMKIGAGTTGLLSDEVAKYLSIDGSFTGIFQVGDGMISNSVTQLLKVQPSEPKELLAALGRYTLAASADISITFKLSSITNGLLPNLGVGSLVEVNAVVSTQTLPGSGLLPGLYVYASNGGSHLVNVIKYAAHNFGALLEAIGGKGVGDALSKAAEAAQKSLSGVAFGAYLNTNSFGFTVTVPAGAPLLLAFPVLGVAGAAALGSVTVSCKVKLTTGAITCGLGYDAPLWVSGLVAELGEAVVSAVEKTVDLAEKALDTVLGSKGAQQVGNVIDGMADVTKTVVDEIGDEVAIPAVQFFKKLFR